MRYMKKRFVWALLLLAMFWSVLSSQSNAAPTTANKNAQTSGKASSMRLESMEGTVKIKNASGKAMTAREDMRLYNGYEIATEKDSAAYINLDDTKVVKLDASSSGLVMQAGKKLEFALSKGSLLFDVSKPLEDDESLNIRTSTMVTGVRGTAGWIEVIDEDTCRIALLEGEVMINSVHPETGEIRQQKIVGGQIATIVFHRDSTDGAAGFLEDQTIGGLIDGNIILEHALIVRETGLTVESLDENNIPEFVKEAVEENPELQQRIKEETDLDVDEIIGKQKLESSENTGTENTQTDTPQDPVIQEPVEEQESQTESEETEADEEDEESSSSSSGGSSSDSSTSVVTYTLTVNYQNLSGTSIGESTEQTLNLGMSYDVQAPTIDGYTYYRSEGDAVNGTIDGNKNVTLIYYATASTIELQNPTIDEINRNLNTENITTVIATYTEAKTLSAGTTSSIEKVDGKQLLIDIHSSVTLADDATLTMSNGVSVSVSSTGSLINEGIISVSEEADFTLDGTFQETASGLYAMATKGTQIVDYGEAVTVLHKTWQSGSTYTLYGTSNTKESLISLITLSGVSGVLDLNGRIMYATFELTNGADLTIQDSGVNGCLSSDGTAVIWLSNGNLTLKSGTIKHDGGPSSSSAAIRPYIGTILIEGGIVDGNRNSGITTGQSSGIGSFAITMTNGTIKGAEYGILLDISSPSQKVNINGGEVSGGTFAINYSETDSNTEVSWANDAYVVSGDRTGAAAVKPYVALSTTEETQGE